jgi:hypothetical protein
MEQEILKVVNELDIRIKKLEEADKITNEIFKTILAITTKMESKIKNIEENLEELKK